VLDFLSTLRRASGHSGGPSEHPDRLASVTSTLGSAQKLPNLLTVEEVAERLRVSIWSVYRRIESGEIPAVRLGSGPRSPIRVDESELEQWLYGEGES